LLGEQQKRLENRRKDPLKQWKISPIDEQALKYWKQYSSARNEMLARSHNSVTPWKVVRANDKHLARVNIIRDILTHLHYKDKNQRVIVPDSKVIFPYDGSLVESNILAP
jgi:polyphosphate kinase 2 (PPK2 family)